VEATGDRAFHPGGFSKSLEASLAWVLATRFVKRRQSSLKGIRCYQICHTNEKRIMKREQRKEGIILLPLYFIK
jgi:hypothetical protein